ncbi:MAG: peroxiredoxin family protein [Ignavibacteria bacterium]
MRIVKTGCLILLIFFSVLNCGKKSKLLEGNWRGVIIIQTNSLKNEVPFSFSVLSNQDNYTITITNAEEKIEVKEVVISNDSLIIKMPVFKDEIRAKILSPDSLIGEYIHFGSRSNYNMPFYAKGNVKDRFFIGEEKPQYNITGKWETSVQPGEKDEYKIIGIFEQQGTYIKGTFLSTSGDFRFLEGTVSGNKIFMSCVDGSHTLLFKADIKDSTTIENGILVGSPNWQEKWVAVKNPNAELPNPESEVTVRPGYHTIDIRLNDLNNNPLSLEDERYKGKVTILQVMGSWCPNCMDETRFFAQLYDNYKDRGFEIIGLCFESKDFLQSKQRIEKFKHDLQAKYEFLYAGEVGKNNVLTTLPFLTDFKGYPTTIYLDKKHSVRKVYTGFSGPGTGKYYDKLKSEIINFIEKLLREQ